MLTVSVRPISHIDTEQELTPTLNSIVPHSTNMVEFPSPFWILLICRYRMMEQSVVNKPRVKIPMRPIFFSNWMLSFSRTGSGITATTTSDTMVTMAYPVNEGPGGRHLPSLRGFHDFSTYSNV